MRHVPGTDEHFKIEGNTLMTRDGAGLPATEHCVLHLSRVRLAQRLVLTLPGGERVWVANTRQPRLGSILL